jgi:Adenylate and Guanylate cyclase catalytic domain
MRTTPHYRYNSLEDFLTSNPLEVDGILDDGWGALFPVKGREMEAAILFIDISGFSRRTLGLTPTETLIYVQNFFAWVTAEGLRRWPGVVDKYIGDEMMVIFAREFGSSDPFKDAIQCACAMTEHDSLSYSPHIGVAAGPVTVGYVGTPLRYNCSVFGKPVALAARCASIRSIEQFKSAVICPSENWGSRRLEETVPAPKTRLDDGRIREDEVLWDLQPTRTEKIKNMPDLEIRELTYKLMHRPSMPPEDRAKESLQVLKKAGRYSPMPFDFTRNPIPESEK